MDNKIIDQNTQAYDQLREAKLSSDVQGKYDAKRASYASKYQRVGAEDSETATSGSGGQYGSGADDEL
jgi:hypothetical protein